MEEEGEEKLSQLRNANRGKEGRGKRKYTNIDREKKGGRVEVGGGGQKVVRTQDKEPRGWFAARRAPRWMGARDSEAKGKKWGARDARNGGGKAAGRAPRVLRVLRCIPVSVSL